MNPTPLLLLIAGLIGAAPVFAAQTLAPTQVQRGLQHQALYAVSFEGERGLAVGAGGEILATEDAGRSWVAQDAPTRLALLGVALKGDTAIAVGQMGTILIRRGNGEWTQIETETRDRLFSVALNAQGVAVIVGGFGTLLRSTDGGAQWASVAPVWEGMFEDPDGRLGFFEPTLYDVQLNDDGVAHIVGEVSLVLRSTDAGASFEVMNAGGSRDGIVDPTLFAIDIAANGRGYAVGQEGTLLYSGDAGRSWQLQASPTNANLLSISHAANGALVVGGMRNVMVQPPDATSWTVLKGADIATGWYGGVAWLPGMEGPLAVGHFASILQFE